MVLVVVFGGVGLGMCFVWLGPVNGISVSIAHVIAFRSCSFTTFLMGIGFYGSVFPFWDVPGWLVLDPLINHQMWSAPYPYLSHRSSLMVRACWLSVVGCLYWSCGGLFCLST